MKLMTCKYFLKGNCSFGNDKCWFSHSEDNMIANEEHVEEYQCNYCKKIYSSKSDLHKHIKTKHSMMNQKCKYYEKSICKFGKYCWYSHNENENKKNGEVTADVIEKLFNMMETLTERIMYIESQV